jgi:glucose-1-phosphate adenylyltransferase
MLSRKIVALILGGGRGTRLAPLTSIRSKPAVPLGGMYRLIDVPISNCLNSGINKIFVLTQFMSVSLHSHIRRAYSFDHFSGGFVELLAAQETPQAGSHWYQGTADAVRKNLDYFDRAEVDYVLILSGDQLYRMDFTKLLETHLQSKADVTISCIPVHREAAKGFGIMQAGLDGRVAGFLEKPQKDTELEACRTDPGWIDQLGVPSKGRDYLASMGIYVFNRHLLREVLLGNDYADFGKEIFPETIKTHRVQLHLFDDYWEDIGTIRSFYHANLQMAMDHPTFEISKADAPIYTRPRFLAPSRISGANIQQSLIAAGCYIDKSATIENSVIGIRTMVGPGVTIRNSILMGNDYYESDFPEREIRSVPMMIGEGSVIDGAIVDKNVSVGKGCQIVNLSKRQDTSLEHPICVIRDGIPIVIKNSILEEGWNLEHHVP